MLARVDARELAEWEAYYSLDPWGQDRADLRAGTIAAVVANSRAAGGGFKPSDFMPKYMPSPEQTENDMKAACQAWAAAANRE